MTSHRLLAAWLPVAAWATVIFAFSSVPHLSSGLGTWDLVLRKCAHMAEYAILAGRHASPVDVGIDAVGLGIGLLAYRWNEAR